MPGRIVEATVLNPHWYAYLMHWHQPCEQYPKGRSMLHSKADCLGCRLKLPTQWTGYLGVWEHQQGKAACLIVSPSSAWALIGSVGTNKNLRGIRVHLARLNSSKTSAVRTIYHDLPPLKQLFQPLDLYPTLTAIYGPELPTLDQYEEPETPEVKA
jgi:hypothetical protein